MSFRQFEGVFLVKLYDIIIWKNQNISPWNMSENLKYDMVERVQNPYSQIEQDSIKKRWNINDAMRQKDK